MSTARWNSLLAESMSRTASSCVRMIGNLRGALWIRHFFERIVLLSVLQKKNRSAAM